jgi:hypothetical protein
MKHLSMIMPTLLLYLVLLSVSDIGFAQPMGVEQIIEHSQRAFYYAANDMRAKVTMRLIDAGGGTRTRVMTLLRRDTSEGGEQKYFIYFHEPGDVRRMTFMVWKDPVKEDQRWIFIPAVDLVRRIAADDKRASFVGSDFTYEDVSGRDVGDDRHSLLREETLDGRAAWVVESLPNEVVEYTKRVSWIDKQTLLPLKEHYFDAQGEFYRIFTADRIETVGGWPTVTQRSMKNLKTGHRTEVVFDTMTYDPGLEDEDFSERRMRRPPRAWTE